MSSLPAHDFAGRRARVLEALGEATMVLPAAPVRYRSHDTEYRYRPDSELFYLTGLREPGAVALLRGGAEERRFVLFVRERDERAERWSGPRLGPEAAAAQLGADAAYPLGELHERLPGLLKGASGLYYRLGVDRRIQMLVERALGYARGRGARKGIGPRSVSDPGELLDEMRLVKDAAEVARIRRAAEITLEGVRGAARTIAPGVGEWEVEADLEAEFRRAGALGPAFATIVASGPNACVLHYVENGRRIGDGDLVLVDAGAELEYYAGDVSRTFPASGRFSPAQRSVYEIVDEARRAAVDAVEPGATTEEVHRAALRVLVEGLIALDLLDGSADAHIARAEELEEERWARLVLGKDPDAGEDGEGEGEAGYKRFFPHQTSHWLGLDTHDPGDYARRGEPRTLEAGMVLTVEPGLYVPASSELDAAAPYLGIGVRIEDDVLVTEEGREVLTADLPTGADEVEAFVGAS